jgi:UDP-glucuronate 4-epimerase
MNRKIIITGCCGFIGMHLAELYLRKKFIVYGIDNLNQYYDVNLKKERLKILKKYKNFNFIKLDLILKDSVSNIINKIRPKILFHMAAQAGVRYSLIKPEEYISNNIVAFHNIIESCKSIKNIQLVYASSSSVYGQNKKTPFCEIDNTDQPVNLYAATKKTNELISYAYSNIYNLSVTGLRFFSVYGPWGRPDMAPTIFSEKIISGEQINLTNSGKMKRDFTYVEDVVNIIEKITEIPKNNRNNYEIYNIGSGKMVTTKNLLNMLEKNWNKKSNIKLEKNNNFEMQKTNADTKKLNKFILNYKFTKLETGIKRYVEWHRSYYSSSSNK